MIRPRKPARPNRRSQAKPQVERLERRALMSSTGNFDRTFGVDGFYSNPITSSANSGLNIVNSVAVEPDGSVLEAGVVGVSPYLDESLGLVHLTASLMLDTSFGQEGEADVSLPAGSLVASYGQTGGYASPEIVALLVQPNGKIIVAAGFVESDRNAYNDSIVERFNADGTPDTGFGVDGRVILDLTSFPPYDLRSTGNAANSGVAFQYAALEANGQIVLAGFVPNSQSTNGSTAIAVTRLDADGQVDSAFGSHGLTTLFDSTQEELVSGISTEENATGLAIAPDGRIVVVGALLRQVRFSTSLMYSAEIFRLEANGTRDPSFSQAGLESSGLNQPTANGLELFPDGESLVIGAYKNAQGFLSPVVVRLSGDGSTHQLATLPKSILSNNTLTVGAVGIASDGDVVVSLFDYLAYVEYSGLSGRTLTLIRLKPDLTPDDSFGTAGALSFPLQDDVPSIPFYGGVFNEANTLAVSPSGQIVVAGLLGYLFPTQVAPALNIVLRLNPTSTTANPGDFDGDSIADPTVYLPSLGAFAISDSSRAAVQLIPFGGPGIGTTIPAAGNYDGTGNQEIGAYLPGLGIYAYRRPTGPDVYVKLGTPGPGLTIPAPGDYYGTGQDDVAVYLADLGAFAVVDPTGKTPGEVVSFGMTGVGNAIPVPGAYFGNGLTDMAVYLPTLGEYEIRTPLGTNEYIPFGGPGLGTALPMPGDYDGSGKTELAVYLPAYSLLAYRPANGGSDVYIPFGGPGAGTVLPAAGDYTGSGRTEPGVYIPALGELVYRPPTGPDVSIKLGIPGAGETVPVTSVVLLSTEVTGPTSGSVSALDFVPNSAAKKAKAGSVTSWETPTTN